METPFVGRTLTGKWQHVPWAAHLAPCLQYPGRWAAVAELGSRSSAERVKVSAMRQVKNVHGGEWEMAIRVEGERAILYARAIAPESDPTP